MMIKHKLLTVTTAFALCVTLGACQTTKEAPQLEQADRSQKINTAIERTANAVAAQSGRKSLPYLERAYSSDSSDAATAIEYGSALRAAQDYKRAALVLAPFAEKADSPALAKTEYAGVQLALGNEDVAEKYAQKAILQDNNQTRAYHYLGIALDAKGQHEEAERAFRKGLENWEGDPTPIMNNLALNLASQNYLEEALDILYKAKSVAPDRIEIERNIRIVRALQESYSYTPPHPMKKPSPKVAAVRVEPEAGEAVQVKKVEPQVSTAQEPRKVQEKEKAKEAPQADAQPIHLND